MYKNHQVFLYISTNVCLPSAYRAGHFNEFVVPVTVFVVLITAKQEKHHYMISILSWCISISCWCFV